MHRYQLTKAFPSPTFFFVLQPLNATTGVGKKHVLISNTKICCCIFCRKTEKAQWRNKMLLVLHIWRGHDSSRLHILLIPLYSLLILTYIAYSLWQQYNALSLRSI